MWFGEDKYNTRDTIVTSTQSRDKLENRESKNNKVSTTIWEKYKVKRRKESSNPRREKDCKIDSRR